MSDSTGEVIGIGRGNGDRPADLRHRGVRVPSAVLVVVVAIPQPPCGIGVIAVVDRTHAVTVAIGEGTGGEDRQTAEQKGQEQGEKLEHDYLGQFVV
jgi:hypothetical protein